MSQSEKERNSSIQNYTAVFAIFPHTRPAGSIGHGQGYEDELLISLEFSSHPKMNWKQKFETKVAVDSDFGYVT